MIQNSDLDNYKRELQKRLEELRECQDKKTIDSCMKCHKILDCTIRHSYVVSVYNSMNKGSSGGFEF